MLQITEKQQSLFDQVNMILNKQVQMEPYGYKAIIIKSDLNSVDLKKLINHFYTSFIDDGGLVLA